MGEGLLLGLSWLSESVSSVLSCGKVVKIFNCLLLSKHVEVKKNFNLIVIILLFPFFFDLRCHLAITMITVFLCDEDFLLFLLFFCSSVSGVCSSSYCCFC